MNLGLYLDRQKKINYYSIIIIHKGEKSEDG